MCKMPFYLTSVHKLSEASSDLMNTISRSMEATYELGEVMFSWFRLPMRKITTVSLVFSFRSRPSCMFGRAFRQVYGEGSTKATLKSFYCMFGLGTKWVGMGLT